MLMLTLLMKMCMLKGPRRPSFPALHKVGKSFRKPAERLQRLCIAGRAASAQTPKLKIAKAKVGPSLFFLRKTNLLIPAKKADISLLEDTKLQRMFVHFI